MKHTHNCNDPALVTKVTNRHSRKWEPNSQRRIPFSPRVFKLMPTKSLMQALVSPNSESSIQFRSQIEDIYLLCISPHILYDNLVTWHEMRLFLKLLAIFQLHLATHGRQISTESFNCTFMALIHDTHAKYPKYSCQKFNKNCHEIVLKFTIWIAWMSFGWSLMTSSAPSLLTFSRRYHRKYGRPAHLISPSLNDFPNVSEPAKSSWWPDGAFQRNKEDYLMPHLSLNFDQECSTHRRICRKRNSNETFQDRIRLM